MRKIYATLASLLFLAGTSQAQLVLFGDNYSPGITFAVFGGSTNNLTVDASTFYSGTASLKVDVPAAGYTGGALKAATNQNVTAYNAVSFWVKASKAATLNVTGLGNNATTTVYQSELANVALTTSWVKVILPIPDASKLTGIDGMWHFAEGADEGAYTIWFDDIKYENVVGVIGTPSATMDNQTLTKAIGGTLTAANAKATYGINSIPRQVTVAPAYLTYTSNPVGRITFDAVGVGTAQNAGAATVTATLAGVAVTGSIGVTVTGGASAPSVAAPTPPARNAGDVTSVYSGAYTYVGGVNFNPGWGQSTVQSEVQVAGNATLKYASLNYQGFEIAPGLNLTGKTKLHFDIWTPDCTEFKFFLISLNPTVDTKFVTVTPTLSGWQSVDVVLATTYNGVVLSNVQQMKMEGQPWGGGTVYIDNIYFYNDGALPVKLSSFTAAKKDKSVVLNWQTATETNNRGFAVERSRDGQTWSEFNFVKATATNGAGSQYATSDLTPAKGMNYYRLKQIDLDGKETYSAVKVVNFNANGATVSVYPNPTKGRVNVNVSDVTGKIFYNITQLTGRTVLSGSFSSGTNANAIDVSRLSAGTYIINITGDNFSKSEKLMLQ
jgi:hypothetical protein